MHESPVARELVNAAIQSAGVSQRITSLRIRLGPEGGYVPESLKAHIRAVASGTVAEDAIVTITPVLNGGAELISIEVEDLD